MMGRLAETSISQAVNFAFPELEPRAAKIIAGWYAAEGVAEDFESTADLAEHIESDITDMVWAASDPEEITIVKAGLINGGFVDADSLPEEELEEATKRRGTIEKARAYESTGGKYKLEYVLYYRGDVYRKVGSFSALSDQEACKKAAMIQANYGPLKDLDAKARAELEEDVMSGFEEYPEQHSDPIEAWDSYITYNSEEFSVRLTAPDGRVLVDTGMDDFAEEEDFEESRKASVDKLAEGKCAAVSVENLLREAAKPVQQDKLGSWYKEAFREPLYEVNSANTKLMETDYKEVSATLQKVYKTVEDYLTDRIGPDKHKIADFFDNLLKYVDYYIDNDEKDFDVKGLEKTFSDFLSKTSLMIKDVLGFCTMYDESASGAATSSIREALADKDWSEFQHYMFNAISKVYQRFNIGKAKPLPIKWT